MVIVCFFSRNDDKIEVLKLAFKPGHPNLARDVGISDKKILYITQIIQITMRDNAFNSGFII